MNNHEALTQLTPAALIRCTRDVMQYATAHALDPDDFDIESIVAQLTHRGIDPEDTSRDMDVFNVFMFCFDNTEPDCSLGL